MKHAETVTFGGSALDRVAHLRGKNTDTERCAVVLWRGKPLLDPETMALCRLPADHPMLVDAAPDPILIGQEEDGRLVEAYDLSEWEPADLDASQLGGFLDTSQQSHPDAQGAVFVELRVAMVQLTPRDAEIAATAKALFDWHCTHGYCANCGSRSDSVKSGWQRDCPDCGRHHFPRTDPVVIMLILRGNSVLVGRSPGWPQGMYSLLAGFVEPGETLEAAVRREVFEETGVRVGDVGYLSSQPWPFPASLMFGCIGEATSKEITIDPDEIEDARWVTREGMVEAMAGRHPEILGARKGAIAHFLLANWLADTLD